MCILPRNPLALAASKNSDCGEQGRDQFEGGARKQSCLQEFWGPRGCPSSRGSGGRGQINGGHSGQAELSSSTQKKAFLIIRMEQRSDGLSDEII